MHKKRVLSNIFWLGILQGANYVLPLVTLPYLVKVIGVDYFGLISFSAAIINYFMIITDYGFNLSATQQISIHRENITKVNEIYSSVITIKFILNIASALTLALIVISFEKLRSQWQIHFITFGTVIGQSLIPIWLFQGMERMKYVANLNIIAKLFFTICIFSFVKKESDYLLVPLFTSSGYIIAGILSVYLVKQELNVKFILPKTSTIKFQLTDGWNLFLSRIWSTLYRNSNIVILGFLSNDTIVGSYSVAEKIIKSIQSMQDVVGNALFPWLTKTFEQNKTLLFKFIKKYLAMLSFTYIILFLIVFYLAKTIANFINNPENNILILNLKIMSAVLFIGGLNYCLGILGLIALNYKKEFANSVALTGIFNVIICITLTYVYKDIGTSISFVLSEIFLLLSITYKLNGIKKTLISSN